MTAAAQQESSPPPPSGCWCCGGLYPETELVRLGEHPEVGLCWGCAAWVKRRACARYHEQHPSVRGRLWTGLDTLRGAAIARGWHERGLFGALLRRIDRYLP